MVMPAPLFCSAGTYPMPRAIVRIISRRAPLLRLAISSCGFRISRSAGHEMSPAVTDPGPVLLISTSISGVSPCRTHTRPRRLRMMSVTSSRTPSIVLNSCWTPSMRIEVTAAPSSDERSTRRSEFPNVCPKPRSSGSTSNMPSVSEFWVYVIRGAWMSSNFVSLFLRPEPACE